MTAMTDEDFEKLQALMASRAGYRLSRERLSLAEHRLVEQERDGMVSDLRSESPIKIPLASGQAGLSSGEAASLRAHDGMQAGGPGRGLG